MFCFDRTGAINFHEIAVRQVEVPKAVRTCDRIDIDKPM
jgi:hypothetical protein